MYVFLVPAHPGHLVISPIKWVVVLLLFYRPSSEHIL